MKNNKLVKLMQADFDSGESLQNIFCKYKNVGIKKKKIAYFVSTLKDKTLIEKHKIAKNTLLGFMFIVVIVNSLLTYGAVNEIASSTSNYMVVTITMQMTVIPMLFLYGFFKQSYKTYLGYLILFIILLPMSVNSLLSGNTIFEFGFLIFLLSFFLVMYLKSKLFPYMTLLGPKKDVTKQYLVAKNS
ncbi:hypothetical protein [Psychromonas aquimarina]|uniref:hypothetical protein n=1 Tax=Psychromonas aquimarina TaxID=444919 RepID=UPI00041A1A86|nr:hypothetical protein [Psychromonas aquimarina]